MRITLEEAIRLLNAGEVVALPTETVYGLAAKLSEPKAIEKIFQLKKRPNDNPLIVHIANYEQLNEIVKLIPAHAQELMHCFWPGPLTIIEEACETVPMQARAGLPTVAVRMPDQPEILEIIKQTGPLVAPSANLSGKPSTTSAQHVEEDFGAGFPVLDGGNCKKGLESTIVYFDGAWEIARLGATTQEQLAKVLGYTPKLREQKESKPVCPGQHYRHYAPQANLTLGTGDYPGSPVVVIGFKERQYSGAKKVYSLGSLKEPEGISASLYAVLRQLDRDHIQAAWVDCNFPKEGLFLTLAERLKRAAKH